MLGGAVAGSAIVAVGERGTILRSTDDAASWKPTQTPAAATLTGVSFADAQHGWAVGHDALILVTIDGGVTWAKQWQGDNLSDSLLDVLALDPRHVIAIGAYGLYLTSTDSGKTWEHRKVIADDYHLNRITRGPSGTLYLAGEHGTLLRSGDEGTKWTPIPTSYEGSFYGILPLGQQMLLAYGLRGRVYRSADDGRTWSAVLSGQTELLATGVKLKSGTIVLAGNARLLLRSADGGHTFVRRDVGLTTGIAQLIELPGGDVLALGEAGATRISVGRIAPPESTARPPVGPSADATPTGPPGERVQPQPKSTQLDRRRLASGRCAPPLSVAPR